MVVPRNFPTVRNKEKKNEVGKTSTTKLIYKSHNSVQNWTSQIKKRDVIYVEE